VIVRKGSRQQQNRQRQIGGHCRRANPQQTCHNPKASQPAASAPSLPALAYLRRPGRLRRAVPGTARVTVPTAQHRSMDPLQPRSYSPQKTLGGGGGDGTSCRGRCRRRQGAVQPRTMIRAAAGTTGRGVRAVSCRSPKVRLRGLLQPLQARESMNRKAQ
jgi:hypothetical protein